MKPATPTSLFCQFDDYRPKSHAHDPATSREAAANHVASGHYATNIELVLALVKKNPKKTANELFALATPAEQAKLRDAYEVRRRLTDLADGPEPMIRRGAGRICTSKNTKMSVWEVT